MADEPSSLLRSIKHYLSLLVDFDNAYDETVDAIPSWRELIRQVGQIKIMGKYIYDTLDDYIHLNTNPLIVREISRFIMSQMV